MRSRRSWIATGARCDVSTIAGSQLPHVFTLHTIEDAERIRTESFGEDKPVDPGHDESAWKKNRRGEFLLMHPK